MLHRWGAGDRGYIIATKGGLKQRAAARSRPGPARELAVRTSQRSWCRCSRATSARRGSGGFPACAAAGAAIDSHDVQPAGASRFSTCSAR